MSEPESVQMQNAKRAFDYERFGDGLEEVTYWHYAWFSDIMSALIFGQHKHVQDHHGCKFGHFMDSNEPPPGREPEFSEIDKLHQRMHALGRDLFISREDSGQISKEAFNEFVEIQSLFLAACNSLLRKTLIDGCRQHHGV